MRASEMLPLIEEASKRIYALVERTPLVALPAVAGAGPAFAKLENRQLSGSFKLRGATNKLLSLDPAAAARGVITSSTGNHGLGVATAAQALGIDAEVFLSAQVSPAKREKIAAHGARIRLIGDDPLAAELAAREAARATQRTYISPYNDPYVVAGQGTIALELEQQLPDLAAVFIATGGGGLVSGIGAWLHERHPQVEVVGCWPENSAVLYECLKADRIIEAPELPTLSESTAGGVESGSITFELAREVLHHAVRVSEEEILAAMRLGEAQGLGTMEGAGGVALAAYLKEAGRYAGRPVVVIICGGNPSPAVSERVRAAAAAGSER